MKKITLISKLHLKKESLTKLTNEHAAIINGGDLCGRTKKKCLFTTDTFNGGNGGTIAM